jgi:hypothetical protein
MSQLRAIALDHCAFDIRRAFEWQGQEFRVSVLPRRDVPDAGPVRSKLNLQPLSPLNGALWREKCWLTSVCGSAIVLKY